MKRFRIAEFSIELDGKRYQAVVDGNSILVDGQPFVVGFEGNQVLVDGTPFDVTLKGDQAIVGGIAHTLSVEGLEEEMLGSRAAGAPGARVATAGAGAVTAIMPGKIVRVLVAEGDEVAEGDIVCVLEAMKMENELKAPASGSVKALYIQPGQDVETGAVLAEIEIGTGSLP
jgi:acetyl-CoA/propionyl-CoA carboxylase biotin carboxyl carrier protein